MSFTEIIIIVAIFTTIALPYFEQRYREKNLRPDTLTFIFTLAALLTLYGGFQGVYKTNQETQESVLANQRIITAISQEAQRITAMDFQFRLLSLNVANKRARLEPQSRTIHIEGTLDSAFFAFEFVYLDVPKTIGLPRAGGTRLELRYYGHNVTFGDLQYYPYLINLDGKQLKFRLPKEKLHFNADGWTYYVDVFIKGRHFKGSVDANGFVTVPISINKD
jgi:hypothetical protein